MATLVSPGVDVSITDVSSYASIGTGTIPLLIIGTHEYKTTPSGSIAQGTLPANAGKLYYISSQREAIQTFGNPIFYTQNGTSIDGYELNEYGLNALYQTTAYSPCYVLRGGVDYSDLVPTTTEPRGEPLNGTVWLNPELTSWGVYQSNGSTDVSEAWIQQTAEPIIDIKDLELSIISNIGYGTPNTPVIDNNSSGKLVINNVTFQLENNDTLTTISNKINSNTQVGITSSIEYISSQYRLKLTQVDVTKELTIDYEIDDSASTKLTLVRLGFFDTENNIVRKSDIRPSSEIGSNGAIMVNSYYASNILYQKVIASVASDDNKVLSNGNWYIIGSDEWVAAKQNNNSLYVTKSQQIPRTSNSGDIWINTSPNGGGMNYSLKIYNSLSGTWSNVTVNVYTTLLDLIQNNPGPSKGDIAAITPYIIMDGNTNNGTQSTINASSSLLIYNGNNWEQLVYASTENEPTTTADLGTLWYNNTFQVDVMINQNGSRWVGYRNYVGFEKTDANGVIMAASKPKTQDNGNPLVDGDLWIDTSNTENYPLMYRYKLSKQLWVLIDKTDHTTPSGIVFADARSNDGTGSEAIIDMLTSNFVDPDAPNPELYPDGTLLFNTRYSTNNVKEWHPDYFVKEYNAIVENGITTVTDYTSTSYKVGSVVYPPLKNGGGRWVSVSGLYSDGSPKMGRHAQRSIIVKQLKAAIQASQDVRSETFYYSLIASPGYPELISDMVGLNNDIKNIAFVVGDTPARLRPTSTDVSSYLSNTSGNDETTLSTPSPYLGVYYPWAKSENIDGSDIVVPPSTVILRTIINSDNMSYPWYPPAGYTRGLVDNAKSVGYIDPDTGSYTVTVLNQAQRDLLYQNAINPIAYMTGKGLVVYGQKTRNATSTAMDRINVSRLMCYLSYKLDQLAKPFLFELNTTSTRANVKSSFDRFLSNIVTLQGITDFSVVCDTSNNTPATIDANELWIDIAIIPTKSIEMIYIPIRIMNTGSDLTT